MVMRAFTRFAQYLVPGALVVCLMSLAAPCAAQENVDAPTVPSAPDFGDGRGSLFAPSAWLVLSTPVRKQIDLKLYGFYIGDLSVPVTQVDIPLRMTKFLTVVPSYMYATGISEVVALAVFWWPGLELVGAAGLGLVLLGALATLIRYREGRSHIALTTVTLLLVAVQLYRSTVA